MTTNTASLGSNILPKAQDKAWVAEVLHSDELRLSASHAEPLGRATLGMFSKFLLWGMRGYVVLSFVLIAAQIYISLKH